jgi:uncharacterized membrane protein
MIRQAARSGWWLVGLLLGAGLPRALPAQAPVARAILFYSPTCPHCHKVIQQDLPGIFARVGGEPTFIQGTAGHVLVNQGLALLLVNVTEPAGRELYDRVTERFDIPVDRQGVPRLLCGDSVLVGDLEIPEVFPRLMAAGRAAGGIPWPAIDGLAGVFPPGYDAGLGSPAAAAARGAPDSAGAAPRDQAAPARDSSGRPRADSVARAATAPPRAAARDSTARTARPRTNVPRRADSARAPVSAAPGGSQPESVAAQGAEPKAAAPTSVVPTGALGTDRGIVLLRTLVADPIGASVALLLIVAMIVSLVWIAVRPPASGLASAGAAVPLLVVVGVGIAAYLAYVETTGATAVCGPVGDCNAVQQSPYARLFGVVPIALIGLGGYLAILAAWAAARVAHGRVAAWAAVVAFLLALAGTAASVVLTVLEPFVIGAVCAWCLTSAAVMTALLWVLAGSGMDGARAVGLRGASGSG